MATVYLAQDLRHDRQVAIKVLRPELAAVLGAERFLAEIKTTANLRHPHILPLFDSGSVQPSHPERSEGSLSFLYYVMPYVEGESLRDRLTRQTQLPIDEALGIAREVADALGYAHSRQIVHRDVKPENILLQGGHAVVADFGIARALSVATDNRLTETGLALGTPHYMSPEQAAGDRQIDGRSDIYALGCVLYEMLAGEPPFTGPTAQAIVAKRITGPIPRLQTVRPGAPDEVERAVTRALAPIPADRFATAAEFAAALAPGGPIEGGRAEASRMEGAARRGGWWKGVALVGILAAAAVGLRLLSRPPGPNLSPSASLIAVLPFAPSGADTALSRLGRDLVFTLSAELDGLGPLRVVDAHTVLAQSKAGGLYTPDEGATLARRFGAGSIVHGSLVREGATVRLDFVLLPTDSGAVPLARGSVSSPSDSIAALTDSAVHVLLRQIWSRGAAPTPSLDAALKTRSVPALRAFLEGEQQIVAGQWDEAAGSYTRAREADPAFWQAYAREVYALQWGLVEAPDTVVAALERHRAELPAPERVTTEAILLWSRDSIALGLERTRSLTAANPNSWFGWLIFADQVLHNGPLLGFPVEEARRGFQKALDLNPNLIPVHEHLMLLAVGDRDTAATSRGLRELTRLNAGPTLTADGYGNRLLQFRFLNAIVGGDSAVVRALTDSIARDPAPLAVGDGSFYDAYRYGFFAAQIRVSQRVLASAAARTRLAMHGRLLAGSWAARGAWDSALATMDEAAVRGADSTAALMRYGLAVVGAWLGAVDQREAESRRPAAVALAQADRADRAEVAWLDGVAALSRRDRRALVEARAALRGAEDPGGRALDRSLAAFDAALAGDTVAAGKALAGLEWEEAAVTAPDFVHHPFTIAVDRLAAAHWLAAAQPDQALRLLTWVDGPFLLHPSTLVNIMMKGLADRERARIEERRGRTDAARGYYREFLRRYDRPMLAHRAMVQEARVRAGD